MAQEGEEQGGGKLTKLGDVVPSIYYDLIARICGGAPFLALLFAGQGESLKKMSEFLGTAGVTMGAVLGSYLIGMLLAAVSVVVCWPINRFANARYGFGNGQQRNEAADAIDSQSAAMGGTLLKMAAEEVLCQNLFSGFVVLWAASRVWPDAFNIQTDPVRRALFSWPLPIWIALILLGAVIHRTSAYAHRVKVYSEILRAETGQDGHSLHPPERSEVGGREHKR